jgi:hypothetical protein
MNVIAATDTVVATQLSQESLQRAQAYRPAAFPRQEGESVCSISPNIEKVIVVAIDILAARIVIA